MNSRIIYPPTYLYMSIAFMVGLHFIIPIVEVFNNYWKLIGVIPIILGIYFNIAADKSFNKYDTTVKPNKASDRLITCGVFKISRNPMYLGMVLILLGLGFILGSLSQFLVIPIFISLLNKKFIQIEEKMLEEKFGDFWIEYKDTTRKWF